MTAQMTNQSPGPMNDLLLTLSEASARTALTVEVLRQRAKRRQVRTVKGNDDRGGSRFLPRDVSRSATVRPTSRTVRSSAADQLASGDAAVLEHTATILQEQAQLIAWLSEELVEERQRRDMAESVTADLQEQLAELERNLPADTPDLAPEDDGTVGTAQETHKLAQMEDQARNWRKRSRRKPKGVHKWLKRSIKKVLALWAAKPERR